MVMLYV